MAADENLHRGIVNGLLRHDPRIDIVSIQQSPLEGADDPTVLEWAAATGRVLLSHDLATIPKYARDRLAAGRKMPGVIAIRQDLPLGRVLEDLILMIECSLEGEFEGRIEFLPLRIP